VCQYPETAWFRLAALTACSVIDLTERERDILQLLAEGNTNTNTNTADRLHLGHKTVRNYVSIIFREPRSPAELTPSSGHGKLLPTSAEFQPSPRWDRRVDRTFRSACRP